MKQQESFSVVLGGIKFTQSTLLQIISVVLYLLFSASLDLYYSINNHNRYFKDILSTAEQAVFENLKKDFDRLKLLSAKRNKVRLKFLANPTLSRGGKRLAVTKKGEFIYVTHPEVSVLISISELKTNIGALLHKGLTFDFDTKPFDLENEFMRSYRLLDSLFVNYRVDQRHLDQAKKSAFISCFARWSVLVLLFALIDMVLLKRYKRSVLCSSIDKIRQFGIKTEELEKRCDRSEAENELMNIIYTISLPEECEIYRIHLEKICGCVKRYFYNEGTNVVCKIAVGSEINLKLHESELTKIITSLIFCRKMFTDNLRCELRIEADDYGVVFSIKDKGFSLSQGKMMHYAMGVKRPHFVSDWSEILGWMKKHDVKYDVRKEGGCNVIEMKICTENIASSNVCHLDDYR